MMLHIPGVLTPEQVSSIGARLDQAPEWSDGRESVGAQGAQGKRTRQLGGG
ncbi:MAG: PKHD-type hydroxylase, partial [Massilia sp.]